MRRADADRAQEGRTGEVGHHREVMAKENGVVHRPPPAVTSSVKLLGLPRICWRCGSTSSALIGMMEVSGDLFSEDLVLCDTDEMLALAWEHLPDAARTRWQVGDVAYRSSKTTKSTYLSNGCVSCRAIFGTFPLYHEEVPEALATHGTEAFVTLATIDMPRQVFHQAYESRWR